mmetsp:Transcript_11936/g.24231  ORF Transcript_11936/g.24231 Transcript_11936/m.24231 type:complete len:240 (-) Transcript_11936:810-1529(-)
MPDPAALPVAVPAHLHDLPAEHLVHELAAAHRADDDAAALANGALLGPRGAPGGELHSAAHARAVGVRLDDLLGEPLELLRPVQQLGDGHARRHVRELHLPLGVVHRLGLGGAVVLPPDLLHGHAGLEAAVLPPAPVLKVEEALNEVPRRDVDGTHDLLRRERSPGVELLVGGDVVDVGVEPVGGGGGGGGRGGRVDGGLEVGPTDLADHLPVGAGLVLLPQAVPQLFYRPPLGLLVRL